MRIFHYWLVETKTKTRVKNWKSFLCPYRFAYIAPLCMILVLFAALDSTKSRAVVHQASASRFRGVHPCNKDTLKKYLSSILDNAQVEFFHPPTLWTTCKHFLYQKVASKSLQMVYIHTRRLVTGVYPWKNAPLGYAQSHIHPLR